MPLTRSLEPVAKTSDSVCRAWWSLLSVLFPEMAFLVPTLNMVLTAVLSFLLFMLALGLLCFFTGRLARPLR